MCVGAVVLSWNTYWCACSVTNVLTHVTFIVLHVLLPPTYNDLSLHFL